MSRIKESGSRVQKRKKIKHRRLWIRVSRSRSTATRIKKKRKGKKRNPRRRSEDRRFDPVVATKNNGARWPARIVRHCSVARPRSTQDVLTPQRDKKRSAPFDSSGGEKKGCRDADQKGGGRRRSGRVTNGPFRFGHLPQHGHLVLILIRAGDSPIFDRISLRFSGRTLRFIVRNRCEL